MPGNQFRILYRQFLFRMVDVELLSADARGDMNKLFGQFAALLVFIGIGLTWFGFIALGGHATNPGLVTFNRIAVEWSAVHVVIATTMLVVGLFAVLSWDSTFPDLRDVMVLAPLPIRSRTLFVAKVAAVATALSITVAALHLFTGLFWPMLLNTRHEAVTAPSIAWDDPLPAASAVDLDAILRRDLGSALKSGVFAQNTGTGAAVGVWKRGEQRVFAYGAAKPDSLFEIGSITKTFTALALAELTAQGHARLDEPVRELLPPDAVRRRDGPEITLLDLATHRSGLPGVPDNLHGSDGRNPFARYSAADLYTFLNSEGLGKRSDSRFQYNNLGYGLLGHALGIRAGTDYAGLVRAITRPMGMRDTVVNLSPEQQSRLIQGYTALHSPVGMMDLGVLAGAGAIRSTAPDMLRYVTANLHPETAPSANRIRQAIEMQRIPREEIAPDVSIGLAWIYDAHDGTYEHSGATAGYTSSAFFSPKDDIAVIVLTNVGPDLFQFAGIFGEHIRERLTGERAISLNSVNVPAGGGSAWDFMRLFAAWWIVMVASGAFIYCSILGVQGLAAQLLPRRQFLRVSSAMQLAAFVILVVAYFLEPKMVTPSNLMLLQSSVYMEWSPSYWFLGLFQQLSGSPALRELATRAWIASGIALCVAALAYSLAYFRTLRRIVEEPDIAPAFRALRVVPGFGSGFAAAIALFSMRTLLRSRQHRLLLAFYLAVGFAAAILFRRGGSAPESEVGTGPLCSSIAIMILSVVGMRVVFSLPIELRANWIFRVVPLPSGPGCMAARRSSLYALSVLPVCVGTALLFAIWPWNAAVKHLAALALLGAIVAELCLHGTQKLPFTCSYLPGKSNFNITLLLSSTLGLLAVVKAARLELNSFCNVGGYVAATSLLTITAGCCRWSTRRLAKSPKGELQFEEAAEPAVLALDLHRDGVTPIAPPNQSCTEK